MVRHRRDGAIEFLGRLDDQVKVRGQRIELGEVEHALRACASVEAAACGVRTVAGEPGLVAWVVWSGDRDAAGLRRELAARLPAYAVPATYVDLERLPVTPHGKLDRGALPEPTSGPVGLTPNGPGRADVETVCRTWARVLHREAVEPTADVFEIGAQSILVMRAAAALGAELGTRVPLQLLFDHPTPRALAAALGALEPTAPSPATAAVQPAVGPPRPSAAQRRMVAQEQMTGQRQSYVLPWAVRLEGNLDADALAWAVHDVVDAHESLHTAYVVEQGELRLAPAARGVGLEREQCAEADVAERLRRFCGTPFDLALGPPVRVLLLRVGETEHLLAVAVHHVAADGASIGVLVRDLAAAYTARTTGSGASIRPARLRYADFAAWQEQVLGDVDDPDSEAARLAAYWTAALRGLPEHGALPGARVTAPTAARGGGVRVFRVQRDDVQRLREVCLAHRCTPFVAVQACPRGGALAVRRRRRRAARRSRERAAGGRPRRRGWSVREHGRHPRRHLW